MNSTTTEELKNRKIV